MITTIVQAISNPFDLIQKATEQYIVHESFYTRTAHIFTSWFQLLPILILLNFIDLNLTNNSDERSWVTLGIVTAVILSLYLIYLEWFVGVLSAIIMLAPLIFFVKMQNDGMYIQSEIFIALICIATYWIFGILQLVSHKFDGVRSLILHPKPKGEVITVVIYNTFVSPFFFLLFFLVSLGYKRSEIGKKMKEKYWMTVGEKRYAHKPSKLDKRGCPIDKYNKPHPMDLI